MSNFNMDDYVPVSTRIEAFKEQYPAGSLQSEIVELTESRVTVRAYAYRDPEDPRPGVGHSSLDIPGKTPYTKGSEVENCETSAWGRALAALGFEVKRGLASAEEVRNKQQGGRGASASNPDARPASYMALRGQLLEVAATHGWTKERIGALADEFGIHKGAQATEDQLREMIARIEQPASGSAPSAPATDTPEDGGAPAAAPATPRADEVEGFPPAHDPQPGVAPTMEDVLAVSGGEEIPPKPHSAEYKALEAPQKAAARAYWAKHQEPQQTRMDAEQMKEAMKS